MTSIFSLKADLVVARERLKIVDEHCARACDLANTFLDNPDYIDKLDYWRSRYDDAVDEITILERAIEKLEDEQEDDS